MMIPAKLVQNKLQEHVTYAFRKIEALESAYETITIGQLVSMRARTHGSTIAIEVFESGHSEKGRDCCAFTGQ